eukprot:TRINITY_DN3208_c0_g1_i3.p1 TRINITY_DN3208_c0_g1~~TRINITY_DN3208_c0_g1_i3.p1  ORF type:complete len:581 (-),score=161.48 TRINITY_DN3208_c0_g1_i3:10-1752(-)
MGSADVCFVTITQRGLSALRVRMHYGHPDFLDGYWVRNRGGVSKASHLINTNEDIFTGYEMIGRDERGTFVEFVSQQKGRETSFMEAYTFEAKLAQGAAQQVRSRHMFYLNKRLPILLRLSLFFGTLGFYMMTLMTTVSIKLYMFSLLMFATSGTTYHQLGLMGSVIAVPWLLPVGFVLALPLLLEYMIHYGLIAGALAFAAQLPLGLVFFVFQMKTKSHYFSQGLFSASGGYKGTGRGFGLDRRTMVEMYQAYFASHFQDALVLMGGVMFYGSVSEEADLAAFLRLVSMIYVFMSWLLAPVLFNPYPTRDGLYEDIRLMMEWINQPFKKGEFKRRNEAGRDRASLISTFWKQQEQESWQGWFMKTVYLDAWETCDHAFSSPVNFITWYIQQTVFIMWRYLPWVVLAWFFWRSESIYYAVTIAVLVISMIAIDKFLRRIHEHITILKTLPIFLVPPICLFYVDGTLSGLPLIQSMFIYVLALYLAIEVILGLWNITAKIRLAATRQSRNTPDSRRRLLGWRFFIPLMVFRPQIIWPYITLAVLTMGNFVIIAFGGAITAFLYNGRVADIWSRAYFQGREG